MKLLIVGHGRHGKDTVCDFLVKHYKFNFISSSEFAARHFIFDKLKHIYTDPEQCYDDRHNNRELWYNLICEYNIPDASKLGTAIFSQYDIYCGLRNKKEFHALKNKGVFDYSIWVDRSDYLPPEDKSSNTIEQWMTDYTIDNNGTLEQLEQNTKDLIDYLYTKGV